MKINKTLRTIKYITIFLGILLITRFLDMFLLWALAKSEWEHMSKYTSAIVKLKENAYNIFLGFSNYERARKILMSAITSKNKEIIVSSYFDLWHPFVCIIYNKDDSKIIPMPWLSQIKIDKGYNEIYVYKFDIVRIIRGHYKFEVLIIPILGLLPTYKLLTIPFKSYKNNRGTKFYLEFSEFHLNFSLYLKNIYVFYFYIPLFLILFLSYLYTKKLFFSFLYFFEMAFLFHPGFFFSSIFFPFKYVLSKIFGTTLNVESNIFGIVSLIALIAIYFFFVKGILHGRRMIKNQGLNLKEKFVILYFLLLPILLRF